MVYVLIGESASGKTTVERALSKMLNLKRIISYTTRPRRENEKNEVDYHFITEEHFSELKTHGFFAENVTYRDWHYGIAKEDMTDDALVIVEPTGFRQLSNIDGLNIVSFYLSSDIRKRIIRMIERGDDIMEVFRRAFSDQGGFNGIANEVDHIINSDQNLEYVINDVKKIIMNDMHIETVSFKGV